MKGLWAALLVLAATGLFTVVMRVAYPDDLMLRIDPLRNRVFAAAGLTDPNAAGRHDELVRVERKFGRHRALTRWHVVSGGLFIMLAPVQLARRVRRRWPVLHRWTGRALLPIGAVAAATGFVFGVFMPAAGFGEASIVAIVGVLYFVFAARAYLAIRRRDTRAHREWMLRTVGLMAAIPGTRFMGAVLDPVFSPMGVPLAPLFALDLWLTFTVWLAVTEWWIRHTRPTPVPAAVLAAAR